MDLLQLQYFRTTAHLENMTRAAEHLYVAQPNLSVSLTRLEKELGVALFERRRGKIRLTEAGRLFLRCVDQTLDGLDEGIRELHEFDRQSRERIRVASTIVDLMAMLLASFLPEHPDISVSQLQCRNEEVSDKVMSGEADLGFCFSYAENANLEYIPLDSCRRVVVLAAGHPMADRKAVSLRELDGQNLVINLARDDRECIQPLIRDGALRPARVDECDDNRVEQSMLFAGGVSVAPLSNYLKMRRELPDLPLRCLSIREALPDATIGMIRRSGSRLSPSALQFYDMVSGFFLQEKQMLAEYEAEHSGD